MRNDARKSRGTSLAKGPAWFIGLALLALGVTGLIFGSTDFASSPVNGDVTGETWLSIAGNGWTWALFAAGGLLLMLAAPMHWGAKTMALIVGLALGAASVISLVDGTDVFGIFAANGMTKLVWGAAAAALLIIALLPRVGKDKGDKHRDDDRHRDHDRDRDRVVERPVHHHHDATVEAERSPATRTGRFDRDDQAVATRDEANSTGAVSASERHPTR
jgi:hypothetical protein